MFEPYGNSAMTTAIPEEVQQAFSNVARGFRGLHERLSTVEGQTMALRHIIWNTVKNAEIELPQIRSQVIASLDRLEAVYAQGMLEGDDTSAPGIKGAVATVRDIRNLLQSGPDDPPSPRFTIIDGGRP